jgi:hypothetical protein
VDTVVTTIGEPRPNVITGLAGAERIDDRRELWLALHRHHRQIGRCPWWAMTPTRGGGAGPGYLEWLTAGEELLFVATVDELSPGLGGGADVDRPRNRAEATHR